jgi:hypothetical protein
MATNFSFNGQSNTSQLINFNQIDVMKRTTLATNLVNDIEKHFEGRILLIHPQQENIIREYQTKNNMDFFSFKDTAQNYNTDDVGGYVPTNAEIIKTKMFVGGSSLQNFIELYPINWSPYKSQSQDIGNFTNLHEIEMMEGLFMFRRYTNPVSITKTLAPMHEAYLMSKFYMVRTDNRNVIEIQSQRTVDISPINTNTARMVVTDGTLQS